MHANQIQVRVIIAYLSTHRGQDACVVNGKSHDKLRNAYSAQPRNRSKVTRPFSSLRVGSGDETIPSVNISAMNIIIISQSDRMSSHTASI